MKIRVNTSGKISLPFLPRFVRSLSRHEREAWSKENGKAFVVLENIDFGFMENLKKHQIELANLLKKDGAGSELELLNVSLAQLKFAERVWSENVIDFVGLEDEKGEIVRKEMIEKDAVLKDEMITSLANELNHLGNTISSEDIPKK